ncbi:MAG: DUF4268 domain-containing protein [Pseudonocardiales bacterium]
MDQLLSLRRQSHSWTQDSRNDPIFKNGYWHIQTILGPDVLIVTFEFDRWWAQGGGPSDRLDVLGLGQDGRLIVAELKRDIAPDTIEMQAVKYAAMVSRFTVQSLAEHYARFREQRSDPCTTDEALSSLVAHAEPMSDETLRRPRIVLLARDFRPVVTATAVWLTEMGLDITLRKFQAYRSVASPAEGEQHTQILISVSSFYPVPNVEEFTVSPVQAQVRAAADTTKRTRDVSTVRRLVDGEAIEDDTIFTVSPRNDINAETREAVTDWLSHNPKRLRATWKKNVTAPLRWHADDAEYTPSGLVRMIVREATGIDRTFQGTQWWLDESGRSLVDLAGALSGGRAALYQSFWARFLQRINSEHADWTKSVSSSSLNWFDLPSGIRHTHFTNVFAQNRRLRSELYIDTGDAASTLDLFERFRHSKDQIESAYGSSLSWEELPGKRACRIADYRPDSEVTQTDEHEVYIDWFFDTGARFRKVFNQLPL